MYCTYQLCTTPHPSSQAGDPTQGELIEMNVIMDKELGHWAGNSALEYPARHFVKGSTSGQPYTSGNQVLFIYHMPRAGSRKSLPQYEVRTSDGLSGGLPCL